MTGPTSAMCGLLLNEIFHIDFIFCFCFCLYRCARMVDIFITLCFKTIISQNKTYKHTQIIYILPRTQTEMELHTNKTFTQPLCMCQKFNMLFSHSHICLCLCSALMWQTFRNQFPKNNFGVITASEKFR